MSPSTGGPFFLLFKVWTLVSYLTLSQASQTLQLAQGSVLYRIVLQAPFCLGTDCLLRVFGAFKPFTAIQIVFCLALSAFSVSYVLCCDLFSLGSVGIIGTRRPVHGSSSSPNLQFEVMLGKHGASINLRKEHIIHA